MVALAETESAATTESVMRVDISTFMTASPFEIEVAVVATVNANCYAAWR
jgi:hypothetical protein